MDKVASYSSGELLDPSKTTPISSSLEKGGNDGKPAWLIDSRSIRSSLSSQPKSPSFSSVVSKSSSNPPPVRLAREVRAIDQKRTDSIANAEASYHQAKALNLFRGTGFAVGCDIEERRNRASMQATEQARRAKEQLLEKKEPAVPSAVAIEEGATEKPLLDLCQKYTDCWNAIEQTKSKAIEQANKQASNTQAVSLRRVGGIVMSSSIEEKRTEAIRDANAAARRAKNILFIQLKKELLQYQKEYFLAVCADYKTKLSEQVDDATIKLAQQKIEQTFKAEASFLNATGDLEQATDAGLIQICTFCEFADAIRCSVLESFAEISIEKNLQKIEESKNSCCGNAELCAQFTDDQLSHFAAEAVSSEEASQRALEGALHLQTFINTTSSELERLQNKSADSFSADISSLQREIELLRAAQAAYRKMAVDHTFQKQITVDLKRRVAALDGAFKKEDEEIKKEAFQKLESLVLRDQRACERVDVTHLLSKLEGVSTAQESYFLCGKQGQLELVPPDQFDTKSPQSKTEGSNLVRLALFRDYGADGLHRFDQYFQRDLAHQIPITVGELIDFIDKENRMSPPAFYLSSSRSVSELMQIERQYDDGTKKIKAARSFFRITSTKDDVLARQSQEQEKEDAIEAAKKAIDEFFKDLPVQERQAILLKFSQKFMGETPLTVEKLRSFIKEEIEKQKSFLGKVNLAPFLYSLSWHIGFAGVHSVMIGSTWFRTLGMWPPFIINLIMGLGHDFTMQWRMPSETRRR